MKIYIGEKGKDANGNVSNDFLARNGLAYGSYYYLNDTLPTGLSTSTDGTFDTTTAGALTASKFEDVDTSPGDPTQVLLGNQNFGTFTFDFDLDFNGGSFSAAGSGFSIAQIHDDVTPVNDADNVEWTAPTAMDGTVFSDGLIFINEDNSNGEIWMDEPDGSNPILIADTAGVSGATDTTGIFDISDLVGYNPGSILLTNNQGTNSSMTVLINPDATLDDANFDGDNDIDGADFLTWQRNFGTGTLPSQGDAENDGDVDSKDLTVWEIQYGGTPPLAAAAASVPEPSSASLILLFGLLVGISSRKQRKKAAAL